MFKKLGKLELYAKKYQLKPNKDSKRGTEEQTHQKGHEAMKMYVHTKTHT